MFVLLRVNRYYCPAASTTNQAVVCGTGHYCPTGSANPIVSHLVVGVAVGCVVVLGFEV